MKISTFQKKVRFIPMVDRGAKAQAGSQSRCRLLALLAGALATPIAWSQVSSDSPGGQLPNILIEGRQDDSAGKPIGGLYQFGGKEILDAAGAIQDVSRYAQTLPSVNTGYNPFSDQLFVRGGNSLENLYVIDDMVVPGISHYSNFTSAGSIISIVDASLIDHVNFRTGGFPSRYGDFLSSVMQINERNGASDRVKGRVSSLGFDVGTSIEGPLGDSGRSGSWLLGVRRSIVDILNRGSDSARQGGLPVIYSVNSKIDINLGPSDQLHLVSVDGTDRVKAQPRQGDTNDQEIDTYVIDYRSIQVNQGVTWSHEFRNGWRGKAILTGNINNSHSTVQDLLKNGLPASNAALIDAIATAPVIFHSEARESAATTRYELHAPAIGGFEEVTLGAGLTRFHDHFLYTRPFGEQSPYSLTANIDPLAIDRSMTFSQPFAHVQVRKKLSGNWIVDAGLRAEHFGDLAATRVAPRLALQWESLDATKLSLTADTSYQRPPAQFNASFPSAGGSLEPTRVDQAGIGLSAPIGSGTRLHVEVYGKRYHRLPAFPEFPGITLENLGEILTPDEVLYRITSQGSGRTEGAEATLETAIGAKTTLQANIAFTRSRFAGVDGVLHPGSFEHPIVVHVLANYAATSHWSFGADASYLAGRPYTPFNVEQSRIQDRGIFDMSRLSTSRLPGAFNLDVRADYATTLLGEPATFFAAILNASNASSTVGYLWNRRTNSAQADNNLGVFAVLGGELRW
jgi:hypothetical protein